MLSIPTILNPLQYETQLGIAETWFLCCCLRILIARSQRKI